MNKKVLIVGSGFMGTSISMGLGEKDISCVESNQDYRELLAEKNIYQKIFSNNESVSGSFGLIFICTRQSETLENILYFCEHYPEALITDIASSKNFLKDHDLPGNFISSHPICGSHKTGPNNAEPNLFKNKEVIIIKETINTKSDILVNTWNALGANTSEMSFREHDRNYAYLSHFPHLFSFLYKEILEEEGINYKKYSGDSMKEILRLSEADKELWDEIFSDNEVNLNALKEKIKNKLS